MRRKQLDELMVGYNTYQFATELCRKTFLWNINRLQRGGTHRMDHQIRVAWFWFWLGYQKFGSWKV